MTESITGAVLLIGGGGFIGQALSRYLSLHGVQTITIGRTDLHKLPETLKLCSAVVHLASSTTPGSSATNSKLEEANVALTRTLVDLTRPLLPKHLLYFSSGGTVYGNVEKKTVDESTPLNAFSPYGRAKIMQEELCQTLTQYGHSVAILRPSNAYGPGQLGRKGFGLISTILSAAHNGHPIDIWGDGEAVRDYIHIDDLINATYRVLTHSKLSGTFNVGSGVGYTVNEVIRIIQRTLIKNIDIRYVPRREVDVRAIVLDASKLKRTVGWKASITLESGLNTLVCRS